jgi:hypothetical protein
MLVSHVANENTDELSVPQGATVEILEHNMENSSWSWIRHDGKEGYVPIQALEVDHSTPTIQAMPFPKRTIARIGKKPFPFLSIHKRNQYNLFALLHVDYRFSFCSANESSQ